MRVLFVEPQKDYWSVMEEYLPPPYGILQLAAYLERASEDACMATEGIVEQFKDLF